MMMMVCVMAQPKPCEEDWCRTGPELITSKGYPYEAHYVTTQDFFVLHMFRIAHGRNATTAQINAPKPVVFLQHGAVDSADTYLVNLANESLAYVLADAGFEVWLGNTRGNKYSRNNTKHKPDPTPFNDAFWAWSYDEMAEFDLPAMIGYVLNVTKVPKLAYVGHSQGTTQMFANLASGEVPHNLRDKVSVFIAMGPVTYMNSSDGFVALLARLDGALTLHALGIRELLPDIKLLDLFLGPYCGQHPKTCESILALIVGLDLDDFNSSRIDVYITHFMSGIGVHELIKFSQDIKTGQFKKYDFGRDGNMRKYGTPTPPFYSLASVTRPPIGFFYGAKDPLAVPKDVEHTIRELPPATVVARNLNPHYAHMDFTWGQNAVVDIYPQIMELIRRYAPTVQQE